MDCTIEVWSLAEAKDFSSSQSRPALRPIQWVPGGPFTTGKAQLRPDADHLHLLLRSRISRSYTPLPLGPTWRRGTALLYSSKHNRHQLTVRSTGSLLGKKPARKCHVLTHEKLDEIEARLEQTPQKSLRCPSWTHQQKQLQICLHCCWTRWLQFTLWNHVTLLAGLISVTDFCS
jgi:hypothetical protein